MTIHYLNPQEERQALILQSADNIARNNPTLARYANTMAIATVDLLYPHLSETSFKSIYNSSNLEDTINQANNQLDHLCNLISYLLGGPSDEHTKPLDYATAIAIISEEREKGHIHLNESDVDTLAKIWPIAQEFLN